MSDISLKDLNIVPGATIKFRMSVSEKSKNHGGLTIYGRSFGNYDQDIQVRMQYKQIDTSIKSAPPA